MYIYINKYIYIYIHINIYINIYIYIYVHINRQIDRQIDREREIDYETVRCGTYYRVTLIRGSAYFKVTEINNIKLQNVVIFLSK